MFAFVVSNYTTFAQSSRNLRYSVRTSTSTPPPALPPSKRQPARWKARAAYRYLISRRSFSNKSTLFYITIDYSVPTKVSCCTFSCQVVYNTVPKYWNHTLPYSSHITVHDPLPNCALTLWFELPIPNFIFSSAKDIVNNKSNNTTKCFFIITPMMFLNLQIITS